MFSGFHLYYMIHSTFFNVTFGKGDLKLIKMTENVYKVLTPSKNSFSNKHMYGGKLFKTEEKY